MKNVLSYIFFVSVLLLFNGCLDYETQFDGPYKDPVGGVSAELPKVVVFTAAGTVYLANEYFEDLLEVDNQGGVNLASINHNHTKVIFKRNNENIQIYDIASATIEGEVPNSESARWFDFHANNETIYFNLGWMLHTEGPEVLLNNPTNLQELSPVSGNSVYIKGVAVYANGNIVYSVEASGFGARLYLTDGVSNLANDVFSEFRENLRLSKDELGIWASNEYGNKFHIHDGADMSNLDTDWDYIFGAPSTQYNGYKIFDDGDRVGLPFGLLGNLALEKNSPDNSTITSIDY